MLQLLNIDLFLSLAICYRVELKIYNRLEIDFKFFEKDFISLFVKTRNKMLIVDNIKSV